MEAKQIDFTTGTFIANGRNYIVMDHLPIGRDPKFNEVVPKLAFGCDFITILEQIKGIYTAATTGESPLAALHKIAVTSLNMMEGINGVRERHHAIYEMAALFINREGENPNTITDQQISEKISDWEAEGIDRNSFFLLAINSVSGLRSHWQSLAVIK